jgi:WD40 repeat protein
VLGEKELEDVGVKFISWGNTADRLYTGSSDGLIKVWNIRNGRGEHLRDLLQAPGPITAGAFSPNQEKLAIGDGTGRVYLISLGDMDEIEENRGPGPGLMRLLGASRQQAFRQRKPFTKHPALPPPDGSKTEDSERARARGYLERGELNRHPHPCIGVVQGPNYANTGFFRAEAHRSNDINAPLLPEWERQQQENHVHRTVSRRSDLREIRHTPEDSILHQENYVEDRERGLAAYTATREQLKAEGAELDPEYDLEYDSN